MKALRCWCVLLALTVGLPAMAQDRIPVVKEGAIRDAWTLPPGAKLVAPGYPAEYADEQAEVCVGIGYLIHADGHTSDFALLKAWSAQEPRQARDRYWGSFARDASAALSQWRFVPRSDVRVPRPVYTVATFVFASPNMAASRERCAIPNLSRHIIELRQDTRASRRMRSTSIFDRLDIDPTLESRVREQRNQADAAARRSEPPPPPPPPPPPNPPSGG